MPDNTTTTGNTTTNTPAYRPEDIPLVGNQPVTEFMSDMVNNPSLAPGTVLTPTYLQNSPNQELSQHGVTGNVAATGTQAQAGTATATSAGPSQQVNPNQFDQAASTYTANIIGDQNTQGQVTAAQGTVSNDMLSTAAQGAVDPNATVKGQLEQLLDFEPGEVPDWARGAIRKAEATMQGRGLGASSIAAEAITSAVIGAALPIAAQDAGAFLQMALKNLDNRQASAMQNANTHVQMAIKNLDNDQQARLYNAAAKQATLLSDQAAANAAKQFNATSENQTKQFFSNLAAQIATQNAARADAISMFDAAELNKVSALNANNQTEISNANASRDLALSQFNAKLLDERQRFNEEMALVIDQSNVNWRRSINTANTAATNAANQFNVQNMFNLSSQALANTWQQWRDEASWANTSAENALNRQHNLAVAALQRQTAFDLNDEESKNSLYEMIGSFAFGLLN